MRCPAIRSLLTGRDRRSIGQVPKVVALVRRDPRRVGDLVALLEDEEPVVRMRAADALEKATVGKAELLLPYQRVLLALAAEAEQQEVRWHLAQLVPRLPLTPPQRRRAVALLQHYLRDESSIVRAFAMQALADLAAVDGVLRRKVVPIIRRLTSTGTPAMRARGRRLLAQLSQDR